MRHNEKLRTSNVVLKKLNELYYVSMPISETPNTYHIYEAPDSGGLFFMFKVTTPESGRKTVIYNGKRYTDHLPLLRAFERNKVKMMFPTEFEDPNNRPVYNYWGKIDWYLREKLGFQHLKERYSKDERYVILDAYGCITSELTMKVDSKFDDKAEDFRGHILRSIDKDNTFRLDFNSVDEALSKINSIVLCDSSVIVKKHMNILDNMIGGVSALKGDEVISVNNFLSGNHESVASKLIPQLEKLLFELKSGEKK